MRRSSMALQSNGFGSSNIYSHFGAASDYWDRQRGFWKGPLFLQNPANRGTTDLQAANDLGFADAGTMQFSRLVGLKPSCYGSAQCLTVLSRVGQAGAHAFPLSVPE